jgi:hypothetical protein
MKDDEATDTIKLTAADARWVINLLKERSTEWENWARSPNSTITLGRIDQTLHAVELLNALIDRIESQTQLVE